MLLKQRTRRKQYKPYYIGPWGTSEVIVTNSKQFILLDGQLHTIGIIPYEDNHLPSAIHTYLFHEKKALCYDAADDGAWLLLSFEDNTYRVMPDPENIGINFSRMYTCYEHTIILYNYDTLCFHAFDTQALCFSIIPHHTVEQSFPEFYAFWQACTSRGYVDIIQCREAALAYDYKNSPIQVYEHSSGKVTEYPWPGFEYYDVDYRNGLLLVMGEDCLMVTDTHNNKAFLYPPQGEEFRGSYFVSDNTFVLLQRLKCHILFQNLKPSLYSYEIAITNDMRRKIF